MFVFICVLVVMACVGTALLAWGVRTGKDATKDNQFFASAWDDDFNSDRYDVDW